MILFVLPINFHLGRNWTLINYIQQRVVKSAVVAVYPVVAEIMVFIITIDNASYQAYLYKHLQRI